MLTFIFFYLTINYNVFYIFTLLLIFISLKKVLNNGLFLLKTHKNIDIYVYDRYYGIVIKSFS